MSNVMQAKFEGVKGYKTFENAVKKGQELDRDFGNSKDFSFRWVVIALSNGRFSPCVIVNSNGCPGGPGPFLSYMKSGSLCVVN